LGEAQANLPWIDAERGSDFFVAVGLLPIRVLQYSGVQILHDAFGDEILFNRNGSHYGS
jgi:hypothetical protein